MEVRLLTAKILPIVKNSSALDASSAEVRSQQESVCPHTGKTV